MINRFTLQFKDKNLEKKFQNYWLNNKRKPVTKILMFGIIILLILKFIEELLTGIFQQYTFLTFSMAYLGYLNSAIMFFITYKWKPQYIKTALFIYNHLLAFGFVTIQCNTLEQQKNMSFIVISYQIVIILTGEFIEACYQIILFSCIYIASRIYQDGNIEIYIVACIIVSILLLIVSHHKNTLAFRSQFQLSFIDQQWEKILQATIKKEYLVFSYNEQTISFNLRSSSLIHTIIQDDKQLVNYIRELKLNQNETFEQYCFNEIKNHHQNNQDLIISQNFIAKLKKQKIYLECSLIYGSCTMILIQFSFNNELQQVQESEFSKISYRKKYQQLLKNMFSILFYKKFEKHLKGFQIQKQTLRKYCLINYFQELEFYDQFSQISQFNYKQIEIVFTKIYFGVKNIQIRSSIELIISNKSFCIFIIMQVIENIINENINITIEENDNMYLQLTFYDCIYKTELINALSDFLTCFKKQDVKNKLLKFNQQIVKQYVWIHLIINSMVLIYNIERRKKFITQLFNEQLIIFIYFNNNIVVYQIIQKLVIFQINKIQSFILQKYYL